MELIDMHEVNTKDGIDVDPKEFHLLVRLQEQNKALRRRALMSAVWGRYPGTLGTIDVHIRHLRKNCARRPLYQGR